MEMEELIQGFLEEASELISNMEESLLVLESQPNDKDSIDSVFRVMHTLKGSGGMFGFTSITSFTHLLENIYDKIRDGKLELNKDILNLTFDSVDLIKKLLLSTDAPVGEVKEEYDRLIILFESICTKKDEFSDVFNSPKEEIAEELILDENKPTYYIYFAPNENIMQNGTNPLYLLDELIDLGEGKAFASTSKIPKFTEIDPISCYCYWDIVLSTSIDLNEILDVFIFVEDDSQIEVQKISESNLITSQQFLGSLEDVFDNASESSLIDIQELADEIGIQTSSNQKKIVPIKITEQENISIKKDDKKEEIIEEIKGKSLPEKALPPPSSNKPAKLNKTSSIRVSSQKVETLINLVSEMVTTQARLSLLAKRENNSEIIEVTENLEKLTRQLRDNAFEISLIPISSLVTRFQRLIRDLSKELNKNVEFITEGTDTELDKTIIENLADPLMHIFRNAIDHGMETKEERTLANKSEMGKLTFKAYYSGTSVYIDISDDGKGINTDIVRKKAIENGLITSKQNLSDQQINELILLPGFSTASNVTDISGRGVGMDVVKRNINKIQGEVEIHSQMGKGTTFSLKLPLTLSIIDGLLIKIDDNEYIIPILIIKKIKPIKHQDVVQSFNNMITVDGEQIPFLYLRDKFNIAQKAPEQEQIVVVAYANKSVGLIIDKVVQESQVVVKPIGKHFQDQQLISGASIMGDGSVALVLDTNKIIDKYSR